MRWRRLPAVLLLIAFCACGSATSDESTAPFGSERWLVVTDVSGGSVVSLCHDEIGTARGAIVVRNDGPDAARISVFAGPNDELVFQLARGESRTEHFRTRLVDDELAVQAHWPRKGYPPEDVRRVRLAVSRTVDSILVTVTPRRLEEVFGRNEFLELDVRNHANARAVFQLEVSGPFTLENPFVALDRAEVRTARLRLAAGGTPGEHVTGTVHGRGVHCVDPPSPQPVFSVTGTRGFTVSDVTAGDAHTCVRTSVGSVLCFGDNSSAQLARAPTSIATGFSASALPVPLPANVTSIAAGRAHTCVVSGGKVLCWGDCTKGQCGPSVGALVSTPTRVELPTEASAVFPGVDASCASLDNGRVSCWGVDHTGVSSPPMYIGTFSDVKDISLGVDHGCLVDSVGDVWCWGAGGRVGDGSDAPAVEPKKVGSGFHRIAAGNRFTCAVTVSRGDLYCWGDVPTDRGASETRLVPTRWLQGDAGAVPLVRARERSRCWSSTYAQCVAPSLPWSGTLGAADALAAGKAHYCVLRNGGLRCRGDESLGQTGRKDRDGFVAGLAGE